MYFMKIKLFIKMLVLVFFGIGCTPHTEIYKGYKPSVYKIDDSLSLVIYLKMTTEQKDKNTTIYGKPYTMIVIVNQKKNNSDYVALKDMRILSSSGTEVLSLDNKHMNIKGLRDKSLFTFKLGDIEYKNYVFSGLLLIGNYKHKFELPLITDQNKEKINKLWENLMGI